MKEGGEVEGCRGDKPLPWSELVCASANMVAYCCSPVGGCIFGQLAIQVKKYLLAACAK